MCCSLDDFGVPDVLKAADAVSCRCGDAGCVLPPQPGDVVRYRIEQIVEEQSDPPNKGS